MDAASSGRGSLADPHAGQPVLHAGPPLEQASAVLILLHGRGATADSILGLHRILDLSELAALAPQAAGHTWYPQSFLAPLGSNQPYLDSALRRIDTLVNDLLARGFPSEKIAIMGFSQGACLTCEFVARHPHRYGAAIALTGGLIGPPGTPRNYPGSLAGTPVFLGTSDPDPHVPVERVQETKAILSQLGGQVELRRYPGMPHTVDQDEVDVAKTLLQGILKNKQDGPA